MCPPRQNKKQTTKHNIKTPKPQTYSPPKKPQSQPKTQTEGLKLPYGQDRSMQNQF